MGTTNSSWPSLSSHEGGGFPVFRAAFLLVTLLVFFLVPSPQQSPEHPSTRPLRSPSTHCSRCASTPPHPGRPLYLDLGANRGNTIQLFLLDPSMPPLSHLNNKDAFNFPYQPSEFRVVGVEAMKATHGAALEAIQRRFPEQVEILWAAAGTEDGAMLRIYRDEKAVAEAEWGAGFLPLFSSKFVDVPTVDVSSWLAGNACKCDYVVVKMNIEGSEFNVLDKMLREGTLCLMDVAHVYFHPKFFPGNESALVQRIKEVYKPAFDDCGVLTEVWSVH